ncbi:MAG: PAS domain S-box protein [Pedobacter sp.]|nr:MAG: PAS domain S-box protein [Pedobacter sp.]
MNRIANWFLTKPMLTGFLFFVFLLNFVGLIVFQRFQLFKELKDREMYQILGEVESKIEQSIKANYNISLSLAFTINENGENLNFNRVADKIIKNNPHLQCVQMVPNGVITQVYPLKGNENALGKDLFQSSEINKAEAIKSIHSKNMYYQGPVNLFQGGKGIIGRLPIFIDDNFWGFAAVVIRLDNFFKMVGIDNNRYPDYHFQFSKVHPLDKREEIFLPPVNDYVFTSSRLVRVEAGDWNLNIYYTNTKEVWAELIPILIFGVSLAALSGYLLNRLIVKQYDLQQMFKHQGRLLSSTETKYKKIFDNAAVGIARVDSKTGQLLEVNQYLCEFLGYQENELIHRKIKSLIHPDDLQVDSDAFKRFLKGELLEIQSENRYIAKDGTIKWGTITISPLWEIGEEPNHHIIILEDSTERKAASDILIASERRIQSLINSIDGIVWESNLDTFENIFISKKVEDILGYTQEEWRSDSHFWVNKLYPEDKERVLQIFKKGLVENRHIISEYRLYHKNGELIWLRDSVTVIEENGKPVSLRGIMIDITEQKQAEKSLDNSFHLLSEQNKRLLNFSYIVSHNLRSHASNMEGITGLIEMAQTEQDRKELIVLLKNVVGNLNETLLNLNNVINIQNEIQVSVEFIDLHAAIQKNIQNLKQQIQHRNIQITNQIPNGILIPHNKAYLDSILLNLTSNAVRYYDAQKSPHITFKGETQGGYFVMQVIDNGVGIDLKKNGDRIFGMYQTFHGNPDAKGYGLFITKNQIEALEGKIEVISELGIGTTFTVYFKLDTPVV